MIVPLQENKELRLALEEQQNVMEMIMSKYREQVAKLLSSGPDPHGADNTAMQRKVRALRSGCHGTRKGLLTAETNDFVAVCHLFC